MASHLGERSGVRRRLGFYHTHLEWFGLSVRLWIFGCTIYHYFPITILLFLPDRNKVRVGPFLLRSIYAPFRRPDVVSEIGAACDGGQGGLPKELQIGLAVTPCLFSVYRPGPKNDRVVSEKIKKSRACSFLLGNRTKLGLRFGHREIGRASCRER